MELRPWREGDLEAVGEIAASSHPLNRYYQDRRLARTDTSRLLGEWVERCCRREGASVFVLDDGGQVRGFAIYLDPAALNRALGTRLVVLDFVCLAAQAQGKGIGRWFIAESLQRLADEYKMVELRTSHHNYPALNCYQALGMRVVSSDFVLHRYEETRSQ